MGRSVLLRHPRSAIAYATIVIATLATVSGCSAAPLPVAPSPSAPTASPITPGPIRIIGQTGSSQNTTCARSVVQVVVNDDQPRPLAGCTGDLSTVGALKLTVHVGDTVGVVGGGGNPLGGVVATGTALARGVVAGGTALERDASLFRARSVGTSTVHLTRGFTCIDALTGRRADLAKCPLFTLTIVN